MPMIYKGSLRKPPLQGLGILENNRQKRNSSSNSVEISLNTSSKTLGRSNKSLVTGKLPNLPTTSLASVVIAKDKQLELGSKAIDFSVVAIRGHRPTTETHEPTRSLVNMRICSRATSPKRSDLFNHLPDPQKLPNLF